jgi:hypothetical protein
MEQVPVVAEPVTATSDGFRVLALDGQVEVAGEVFNDLVAGTVRGRCTTGKDRQGKGEQQATVRAFDRMMRTEAFTTFAADEPRTMLSTIRRPEPEPFPEVIRREGCAQILDRRDSTGSVLKRRDIRPRNRPRST